MFIRLPNHMNSNINLTVSKTAFLKEFLVLVIYFENTVEFFSRNNYIIVCNLCRKINDAVTATLNKHFLS